MKHKLQLRLWEKCQQPEIEYATLMAESEEELKSLLMEVKESGKSRLKTQHLKSSDHGIQSHHSYGK